MRKEVFVRQIQRSGRYSEQMNRFWQEAVESDQVNHEGRLKEGEGERGPCKRYLRAKDGWLRVADRISKLSKS